MVTGPVFPALRKLRQEAQEFKASLKHSVKPCKNKQSNHEEFGMSKHMRDVSTMRDVQLGHPVEALPASGWAGEPVIETLNINFLQLLTSASPPPGSR